MIQPPANLTSSIGFSLTWDLLVFVAAIAAVFLYGMAFGKGRILTLILSTYFSFLITTLMPWQEISAYFNYGEDFPSIIFQAFVFLALIVAFCFLLPNSVLGSVSRAGRGGRGPWWKGLVFSVLEVGFLTSVILFLVPSKDLSGVNPFLSQFFAGEFPKFIWILLPILAMVLLRRGRME
jgi:hypothetical protein